MFSILKLLLTLFAVTVTIRGSSEAAATKKWWETASFYQVYPRSFKDSDGDGVGDLNGVTEQLEYLKEIGITAAWLSPIFDSPMVDFGYDIRNFTKIDATFGTMEDFEALIAKAKKVGIKIILDFVPNHSSDECEWFIKSAANEPYYNDLYIWHPGKFINGIRQEPTNWRSIFRGSQWTWHEGRQQYYLHQFHYKQPDFNFRNPKVLELMKDVLRFWIRKGVDGFRVDAVPFFHEAAPDENGNLPDEPRNQNVNDPMDHNYVWHIHTVDLPENIPLVYEFRSVLDEMKAELGTDDLVLMTEAYSSVEINMKMYGNETMEGSHVPFNFDLCLSTTMNSNALHFVGLIKRWLDSMPPGRTANWVLGNHDQSRIGSKVGADRIDLMNMLALTLPGCSVTYYGEEIGMTDVWISWEDTIDPQACQSSRETYEKKSRDPMRTPLQWNYEKHAGFSNGESTWLPVALNYKSVNVKLQRRYAKSHLNIFKELTKLRLETTMQYGDTDVKALGPNVIAVKRFYDGHPTYVILINIMDQIEFIDLSAAFSGLSKQMECIVVTSKSVRRKGEKVRTKSILLLPKESIVFRTLW